MELKLHLKQVYIYLGHAPLIGDKKKREICQYGHISRFFSYHSIKPINSCSIIHIHQIPEISMQKSTDTSLQLRQICSTQTQMRYFQKCVKVFQIFSLYLGHTLLIGDKKSEKSANSGTFFTLSHIIELCQTVPDLSPLSRPYSLNRR